MTVKEIQWVRKNRTGFDMHPPTKPPYMTPMENPSIPKIVIAEGPWTFNIPINQENK